MSGRPWWNLEPHGTQAAWRRHERYGQRPCQPCREAHNRYTRDQMRAWRRARAQAFWRAQAEEAYRASVDEWRAEHAESVRRQQERAVRTLVALLAEVVS